MARHRKAHDSKTDKCRCFCIHGSLISDLSTTFRAAYVGALNGSRLPSCTVERRARSSGGGAHLRRCGSAGMVAARNRSFEREHAKDVFVDERREALQVGQRELRKIA